MHTESARRGRHVFLFAHPDDEFGCFESIRRAVCRDEPVSCFYLTDGGYNGQPIEPRVAESTRVLTSLGVAPDDIHFVGIEAAIGDGHLPEQMPLALKHVAMATQWPEGISVIYVPAWEGGHQDHDAAHLVGVALSESLSQPVALLQFSLYNASRIGGPFFRVMTALKENGTRRHQFIGMTLRLRYLRLCFEYPSQRKTWMALLPFVFLKLMAGGRYTLQGVAKARVLARPHAGRLLYERRGNFTFEALHSLGTEFLSREAARSQANEKVS